MLCSRTIFYSLTGVGLLAICVCFAGCDQSVTPPAEAAAPPSDAALNNAAPNNAVPTSVERVRDTFAESPSVPAESVAAPVPEADRPGEATLAMADRQAEFANSPPTTQSTTARATAASGTIEVKNANVEAIDTVEVPAQEAGVIRELNIAEGDTVSQGAVLGQIDDDRAKIELQLARIERDTSKEQAENDVNLQYAIAAEKVAAVELRRALEANQQAPGTFPDVEVDRLRLVEQRSKFQVDQARLEMKVASMTLKSKEAQVTAAEASLVRRQIITPRTGVVVKLYKRAGEWVDPGNPVLKMVRSDRMRVEGYVNAREYDPHTVVGKPVRVTVELARGRKVEVVGVLKLPDLTIGANGEYRIWAEVENKKDGDAWLLRPGQRATMTIQVE